MSFNTFQNGFQQIINHIYTTPLLGQDMTLGQFLSGVLQVWIQFSFS